MELPRPMDDIHEVSQFAEAREIQRGQHEEAASAEGRATKLLTLVCVGVAITVLRLMFSTNLSMHQFVWRLFLGAAALWVPTVLLVLLFGAGSISLKRASWMGTWPSLFALGIPLALVLIPVVVVLLIVIRVLHYPIVAAFQAASRSRRSKIG